jgi:predicted nuclease with TOPRIM domain
MTMTYDLAKINEQIRSLGYEIEELENRRAELEEKKALLTRFGVTKLTSMVLCGLWVAPSKTPPYRAELLAGDE